MVHAARIVRRVEPHVPEYLLGRDGPVPPVQHVGPRRHHGARRDDRIIRRQEAALAGIHVLVGLRRKGGRPAEIPRLPVPPAGPHGVGAVLDQADVQPVADFGQPVHVGDMAAHVRQQQEPRPRLHGLGLEVRHVDVIVGVDVDKHRHAADIVDRARDRRQRIGVGEHPVAGLDAAGAKRKLDGVAAGRAGDAVIDPLPFGIFALELACLVGVALGKVVAVQAAALHHFDGAFDRGGRNRLLLREGLGEFRAERHGIPRLDSCRAAGAETIAPDIPAVPFKSATRRAALLEPAGLGLEGDR